MENTTQSVKLLAPIQRGDTTIDELVMRRPKMSDLKGLSLTGLLSMEVDALARLIMRISTPTILIQELEGMDADAFTALASEALTFFVPQNLPEAAATIA